MGWCATRAAVALLCAAVVLLVTEHAVAAGEKPMVVLLERTDPTGSLREALRIQLPRSVVIEVAKLETRGSTPARIRRAHEIVASRSALVALWIEEDDEIEGGHEVTVYFVGRSGDRALVELLRVRAGAREEIDRAVAVKAVEVVEALQSIPESNVIAPFARARAAPAAAATEPAPKAAVARSSQRLASVSELGAAIASPSASADAQVSAHAGLGMAFVADAWSAEALLMGRVPTSLSHDSQPGELTARELDLFASVRGLWLMPALSFGGFAGVGARLLSVDGTTARGTRGRADRTVPVVAFGPEARLRFMPWLNIRVAIGVELNLKRQQFALNAEPLLDLGPGRGLLELGLTATAP